MPFCIRQFLIPVLFILAFLIPQQSSGWVDSQIDELSTLWERALESYHEKNYEQASHLFTQWIKVSRKRKIFSSQAHYNLALSLWAEEKAGDSVDHFLKSASFSNSPLHIWQIYNVVSDSQKKLGIMEPITENMGFSIYLFFTKNLILLTLILGFWGIVGVLIYWVWKAIHPYKLFSLLALPLLLLIIGTGSMIHRIYSGNYSVLTNSNTAIPVYQEPQVDKDKTIVELPPGTLVSYSSQQTGFTKIEGPIVGWVATNYLSRPSR